MTVDQTAGKAMIPPVEVTFSQAQVPRFWIFPAGQHTFLHWHPHFLPFQNLVAEDAVLQLESEPWVAHWQLQVGYPTQVKGLSTQPEAAHSHLQVSRL